MNGHQNGKTNNFDSLRLIAASLVVLSHSFGIAGGAPESVPLVSLGPLGVSAFFVTSGYLVTGSWVRDPNVGRYLMRRALRIFPALALVVIFTAFVLGPIVTTLSLGEYLGHPTTWSYLRNIALDTSFSLPGVFEHNPEHGEVNKSLWSLPLEFEMYLLTPALLLLTRARLALVALAACACVAVNIAMRWFDFRPEPFFLFGWDLWYALDLALLYLMGMLIALSGLEKFANLYVALLGIITFCLISPENEVIKEMMLLVLVPYVCISFALAPLPSLRGITGGLDLSYGVFLWGFPVGQSLVLFGLPRHWGWVFFATMVISLAIACISWTVVEKPMLGFKPSRRRPAPASLDAATEARAIAS